MKFNSCEYGYWEESWDGENEMAWRECEKGHNENLPSECETCKDYKDNL